MTATAEPLLTIGDLASINIEDRYVELVRGRLDIQPLPQTAHGYYCGNVAFCLNSFVQTRKIGRVCARCGIVTHRNPDTVRGADVTFYSYKRVPRGELPDDYWPSPELVCEVKPLDDRWPKIHKKIAEYLEVGVLVVWVVVPLEQKVHGVLQIARTVQMLILGRPG